MKYRERGCNSKIQKSSNKLQICDFDNDLLSTSSMTVILAWALKLWTITKHHFYVLLFIIKLYSNALWFFAKATFHQINHAAVFTSKLLSAYKGIFHKRTLKGWTSFELGYLQLHVYLCIQISQWIYQYIHTYIHT